jgi:hypothetical protein
VEVTPLNTWEKAGGGGRSRTYDAADMSRVDNNSNLLDLLKEILLEAGDGDNSAVNIESDLS